MQNSYALVLPVLSVIRLLFCPAVTEIVRRQLGGALTGEHSLAVAAADTHRALLGREVCKVPWPFAHNKGVAVQTRVDGLVVFDLKFLGKHLGGKAVQARDRIRAVLRQDQQLVDLLPEVKLLPERVGRIVEITAQVIPAVVRLSDDALQGGGLRLFQAAGAL